MIIIIHPGSLNLRMGRASDLNPHRILNVIARRRKPGGDYYRDAFLPPVAPTVTGNIGKKQNKCHSSHTTISSFWQNKELLQELEDCRLQVSHNLQSCSQSDGRRRYATPPQQISAFNRRSNPEVLDTRTTEFYDPGDANIVIGDDVANLDPNGEFNIHFPIRRGDFNLHSCVGGSLTAVISDLQAIWEYVLRIHLKIKLRWVRFSAIGEHRINCAILFSVSLTYTKRFWLYRTYIIGHIYGNWWHCYWSKLVLAAAFWCRYIREINEP